MEKIRLCIVCGKKIRIIQTMGRNSVRGTSKLKYDSKEGIFFHLNEEHSSGKGGKWFCNKCWEQIIAKSKTQGVPTDTRLICIKEENQK